MNTFGFFSGVLALAVIGFGFVWVIRGERYFGYLWWPYVLSVGVFLVFGSLFVSEDWASVWVGLFGASVVWGATELKEQAVRAKLGWFPLQEEKIQPPFADVIKKWKAPHL